MKGLRYTTVWDFLNKIQTKAKANVSKINQNNLKMEELKQLSGLNNIESGELIDRFRKENKDLMEENSLLLNLHQKILTFSNEIKLEDNAIPEPTIEPVNEKRVDQKKYTPTTEECVSWVVDKYILPEENHPCFCDEKIVDEIYNALIERERYEECAIILKIKEKNKLKR